MIPVICGASLRDEALDEVIQRWFPVQRFLDTVFELFFFFFFTGNQLDGRKDHPLKQAPGGKYIILTRIVPL